MCLHASRFCWPRPSSESSSNACAFTWPIFHLEGCITYAYFWEFFFIAQRVDGVIL
jgi:hypothetical protein